MKKEKEKEKIKLKDVLVAIVTILITFCFTKYVAGLAVVVGDSMNDTFHSSQILLEEKISNSYDRFDVITFRTKKDDIYIKRVIGLPGETIHINENGDIYINDKLLEENYGKEIIKDPGIALTQIILGENEYFVLGDNRNNSIDSRFEDVGVINSEKITGKILFH
jgi:signal peptidase I